MLNRFRFARKYEVVERFAFDQLDALELDSNLELTPDPKELLEIANRRDSAAGVDPRRWYEGIMAFDVVMVMTLIERNESTDKLRGDLGEFINLLEEYVFVGPPKDRVVYSYHRRGSANYMVDANGISLDVPLRDVDPALVPKRSKLGLRPLVAGGEAYVTPRPKGPFWTALKLYRQVALAEQGKWDEEKKGHGPYFVSDRQGIRIVVPSIDLVYDLIARIVDVIQMHGGEVGPLEKNMTGDAAVDPTNTHSSPNFRAAKFDATYKGNRIEIQFMTLWDYMTNKYATDEAGWYMYKLKQMIENYLEFLAPRDLFGYNWTSDMGLRHRLRQQMIDKLGWARHEASSSS
jgi:hypothetical protein